nr:PREDICTED: serine/arginine repetitive matrix protein 2-like isoform X3 [Bemisia tabaci]
MKNANAKREPVHGASRPSSRCETYAFYSGFVAPLIQLLPKEKDQEVAQLWLNKLNSDENEVYRIQYVLLLFYALHRGKLSCPFDRPPPDGKLPRICNDCAETLAKCSGKKPDDGDRKTAKKSEKSSKKNSEEDVVESTKKTPKEKVVRCSEEHPKRNVSTCSRRSSDKSPEKRSRETTKKSVTGSLGEGFKNYFRRKSREGSEKSRGESPEEIRGENLWKNRGKSVVGNLKENPEKEFKRRGLESFEQWPERGGRQRAGKGSSPMKNLENAVPKSTGRSPRRRAEDKVARSPEKKPERSPDDKVTKNSGKRSEKSLEDGVAKNPRRRPGKKSEDGVERNPGKRLGESPEDGAGQSPWKSQEDISAKSSGKRSRDLLKDEIVESPKERPGKSLEDKNRERDERILRKSSQRSVAETQPAEGDDAGKSTGPRLIASKSYVTSKAAVSDTKIGKSLSIHVDIHLEFDKFHGLKLKPGANCRVVPGHNSLHDSTMKMLPNPTHTVPAKDANEVGNDIKSGPTAKEKEEETNKECLKFERQRAKCTLECMLKPKRVFDTDAKKIGENDKRGAHKFVKDRDSSNLKEIDALLLDNLKFCPKVRHGGGSEGPDPCTEADTMDLEDSCSQDTDSHESEKFHLKSSGSTAKLKNGIRSSESARESSEKASKETSENAFRWASETLCTGTSKKTSMGTFTFYPREGWKVVIEDKPSGDLQPQKGFDGMDPYQRNNDFKKSVSDSPSKNVIFHETDPFHRIVKNEAVKDSPSQYKVKKEFDGMDSYQRNHDFEEFVKDLPSQNDTRQSLKPRRLLMKGSPDTPPDDDALGYKEKRKVSFPDQKTLEVQRFPESGLTRNKRYPDVKSSRYISRASPVMEKLTDSEVVEMFISQLEDMKKTYDFHYEQLRTNQVASPRTESFGDKNPKVKSSVEENPRIESLRSGNSEIKNERTEKRGNTNPGTDSLRNKKLETQSPRKQNFKIKSEEIENLGTEAPRSTDPETQIPRHLNFKIKSERTEGPRDNNSRTESPGYWNRRVHYAGIERSRIESPEKRNHRMESPEKKNNRIESPERKNHRIESQEKKNHRIESPQKKNHRIESPEKKNYRIESPERKNHRIESPEEKNRRIESPEKKNHGIESPEKKNYRMESPEERNHRIRSPGEKNHGTERPWNKNSKIKNEEAASSRNESPGTGIPRNKNPANESPEMENPGVKNAATESSRNKNVGTKNLGNTNIGSESSRSKNLELTSPGNSNPGEESPSKEDSGTGSPGNVSRCDSGCAPVSADEVYALMREFDELIKSFNYFSAMLNHIITCKKRDCVRSLTRKPNFSFVLPPKLHQGEVARILGAFEKMIASYERFRRALHSDEPPAARDTDACTEEPCPIKVEVKDGSYREGTPQEEAALSEERGDTEEGGYVREKDANDIYKQESPSENRAHAEENVHLDANAPIGRRDIFKEEPISEEDSILQEDSFAEGDSLGEEDSLFEDESLLEEDSFSEEDRFLEEFSFREGRKSAGEDDETLFLKKRTMTECTICTKKVRDFYVPQYDNEINVKGGQIGTKGSEFEGQEPTWLHSSNLFENNGRGETSDPQTNCVFPVNHRLDNILIQISLLSARHKARNVGANQRN